MATVAQGQSQLVNLGPNDAIKVSTPGEAYVDHLSGTPESPYASTRLVNTTSPKVFGPYGANAQLRVRAIELLALYDGYTDPQPALVNTAPTTGQTVIVGPDGFPLGYATKVDVLSRPRTEAISAQFNLVNSGTAGANFTWEAQKKAKARPVGIRVGHCNQSAVAMNLKVGVYQPTDATSTGTTEEKYPLPNLNVPAAVVNGSNVEPVVALSDILWKRGVDRTDGKSGFLYRARVYQSTLIQGAALPNTAQIDAYNGVYDSEIFYKAVSGDQVLTNTAATNLQARIIPSLIQFIYDVPTLSVMSCDDSLKRGQGSTSGFWSAEAIACAELSSESFVFEFNNQSISGRSYKYSVTSAIAWIKAKVCDVLVIKNHSPNSGFSAEAFFESTQLLATLVSEAQKNGVRILLCTQGPWNLAAAENDRLLAHNASTLATYSGVKGVYLVDEHAIMVDPGNPARARSTDVVAAWTDNHYNMTGYTRLSTEGIKPALRYLVG